MPKRDSPLAARVRTQHLLLADALATHGSMLRAADALHMSQPACSKLLHQLELLAGSSLFTRHARGMAPTLYFNDPNRHLLEIRTYER